MRRDKKTKRLSRYVLTIETLELRCLLAFDGLALVQANETQTPANQIKPPPDQPCAGADAKYCELLRFRFGFDAQEWSQPNSPSTPRGTGFGMSKDFDGAAGQIAGGKYLNDTPLAGDWSGSGYTNIGTARWQEVSKGSVERTWMFYLSTDRDPHIDQGHKFPLQFSQVASEALLPIPLAGNLDGKNGADLAVVDVVESPTKEKQLRWRMAMEEPANTISYPSSAKDLKEVIFGFATAKPAVGYFRKVNGAPQFGIAAVSVNTVNVTWSILYVDTNGKYSTANESETIDQTLNAEIKGQWEPIAGDFDGDGNADLGIIEHKGSELLLHVRGLRDPVPLTNTSRASDRVIVGKWAQTQWSSNQVSNKAPKEYNWASESNWQGSEARPVSLSDSLSRTSNVFIEDRGNGTLVENSIVFQGVDRQAITDIKARAVLKDAPNPSGKTTNTFAEHTNFSSLRIEGGENTLSGTTHIQTADLEGGLRASDTPAPYNDPNYRYSIFATGGSTKFTGNTIVDAPIVVSGGVLEFASNNLQIGTLAISGTGKVILSGTGIAIQRIEISGDGKLELRAALTGSVNLSLDGGEIAIAYNARKEPLGPNAIVNVTSNGSILSAPIPTSATPESEPQFTIANAINLQGNLTVGNATQDPADTTLSERASYLILSGKISGAGIIVKKGQGTVVLVGDSNYTGQTIVEEGELIAASANALGATTGSTRITGGWLGILQNDKQPFTVDEPITVEALGSMNLRQSASLNGLVTLNNSVLQVEPGSTVASTITVTGSTTIAVIKPLPPNDNPPVETVVTLTAPIVGTGDLNWLIPIGYTATVSSPSSRRGATRVRSGGTLQLSTTDAIPADQALELSQQSTLDLNGNSLTVSSLTGDGKINLGTNAAAGSLFVDNSQLVNYTGTVVGTGSFTKRGAGELQFGTGNSFTGPTIIESGTLFTTAPRSLSPSSSVTIGARGNLTLGNFLESIPSINNQGTLTLGGNQLFIARDLDNSGTLDLRGSPLTARALRLRNGQLLDSVGNGLINTVDDLFLDNGQISVPIRTRGGLIKDTSGTVTLDAVLLYDGDTTLLRGTLVVDVSNAIPATSATTLTLPATLQLNASTQRFTSLVGAGTVSLLSPTTVRSLLILEPSVVQKFAGTITGSGDVTKRGSALLTLSGASSFAGDLIVESGGLNLAEANAQHTNVEVRSGNLLSVSGSNARITTLTVDLGGTANISSASATFDNLIANGHVEIVKNGNVVRQLNIGAGGVVVMSGSLANSQNLAIAINGGKIEFETFEPFASAPIAVASQGATFLAKFAKGGSSFNNPITLQNNAFATFDWDGIGSPSVGFAYTGVITGTGGLRKIGSGFLNLTQKSNYSGQTQVKAGELLIGVTNALPLTTSLTVEADAIVNMENRSLEVAQIDGPGTIQGKVGAVLSVGGTNVDSTFAGRLVSSTGTANDTGSLTLTKVGTGKLTLTGTNTYTGATKVEGGTLIVQGGNALPDTSPITVSSGTLDFNNTNESFASLNNLGSVMLGSGTTRALGNFTSSATLQAGTGTLEFAAPGTAAQTVNINNGRLNNARHIGPAPLSVASALLIDGTLTNEQGAIDLNGATVTTGSFSLLAGSIVNNARTGSLTSSTLFDLQNGTVEANLSGAGSLVKSNPGLTVTLAGTNDYTGATTISAGRLLLQGGNALPNASSISVASSGTLDFNNTNESFASLNNLGSVVLGSGTTRALGNFTSSATLQAGTGTLEFAAPGTAAQTVNINNGRLNNARHIGPAPLSVASALLIDGTLTNEQGAIDLNGATVTTGSFSLLAGSIVNNARTGSLTSSTLFDLQNGTVEANLSGAGSLVKSNPGLTVTLAGTNDYTGATTISAGRLLLQGGNALPNASSISVASSGTLDFNNTNESFASLNNLGSVVLGSGTTRALGNFTSSATLQAGTGTLEFAAPGTAAQTVNINNGRLNNARHIGPAPLSVASALLIDGTLTNEQGAIDLNGATVTTGSFSLLAGSIVNNARTGSLTSSTLFDLQNGTVAARLNGAGGLLKSTSGVVLLSSKNSLSGIATIDAGTLRLGSGASLDGLSNVIISRPGTLDLNDQTLSVSGLAGTGTIVLGAGLLTASMAVDGAFGGTISGTGGLVKQGSGLLDLSGANEYLGDTHIAGGTLVLSSKNAVSQSARMLIDTGGTLEVRASEQSIRGLQGSGKLRLSDGTLFVDQAEQPQLFDGSIDGDGLIQKNGTASLILSGNGDYQGSLVVQSGSLQVNGTLASAKALVRDGSSLQGRGTLGDVTIAEGGSLRPGNSPGRMTINNLVLNSGSSLVFEIAGPNVATQYDQVVVKSLANLGGRIEVVLIDGYVPKSGDVFDLVLFANRSGLPGIELPGSNGLVVWRNVFLTSALRVIVDAISPGPGGGYVPIETGPGDGNTNSTPAPIPKLLLAHEDSVRDSILLVSLAAAANPRRNLEATDWFEQVPDYIPIDPAALNETAAIEVVVDEILSADSFADLSSFTSDVQPYAAVSLAPPIEYFDDVPPPPPPPKNLEVPYTFIAAGATFLLSGLALLAMTFSRSRRRDLDIDGTAVEELASIRLDEMESIDLLRESGVESESVTSKGHVHE